MAINQTIATIQRTFPRVYFACHTRHRARRSHSTGLSDRDGDILAHLDADNAIPSSRLAMHLGRARSTISEALKRLTRLGFVLQGRRGVHLSSTGIAAVAETSVLETDRLRAVLEAATPRELARITAGFDDLARVCRRAAERGT